MNGDKIMEAIGMIDDDIIVEAKEIYRRKYISKKVLVSLIAAIILIVAFGITSFAKYYVGSLDEVLYQVFPTIAQSLKPVNVSCENNGIKMEVISANIEGNKANVYISMQDLTGDRIDKSIDLYDSTNFIIPYDQSGICRKIGYDEKTRTATFLITIQTNKKFAVPKGKVTFSVGCFLSDKIEVKGYIDGIDLNKAELNPEFDVDITRYSRLKNKYDPNSINGKIYRFVHDRIPRIIQNKLNLDENYFEYEVYREETEKYLLPGETLYITETGAEIVSIGFIDNKLHILVYYGNRHYSDHIGFLSIYDKNGSEINATEMKYINNFGEVNPNYYAPKETWVDYTFEISPEEIENCKLYGEFWKYQSYTDGDWKVTFRIP